jgi:ribonuclease III
MNDYAQIPSFHSVSLLQQALTHKSFNRESGETGLDNERLEFLGDAILDFLSAEFFFQRYPTKTEGELTQLRAALVSEPQLAIFAQQLRLGEMLRMNEGVARTGGRQNPNLLSSAFEALIGAYFLDRQSQILPVQAYLTPFFESAMAHLLQVVAQGNCKSRLQEWAQLNLAGQLPEYRIVHRSGPDHSPEFTAQVWIVDRLYGEGEGRSKQMAEVAAACNALKLLGLL